MPQLSTGDLFRFKYLVVSLHRLVGDMLRAAVAAGTPVGLQAKDVMAAGGVAVQGCLLSRDVSLFCGVFFFVFFHLLVGIY